MSLISKCAPPSGSHTNVGLNGGTSDSGADLDTICSTYDMVGRSLGFGLLHARPRSSSRLTSSAAAGDGLEHERAKAAGGGARRAEGAVVWPRQRRTHRCIGSDQLPQAVPLAVQPPHPARARRAEGAARVTKQCVAAGDALEHERAKAAEGGR